jgi:hypothetical protein
MVSKGLTGAIFQELHTEPTHPAHAGYPVRRGISVLPCRLWNTGSPALAGDDDRGVGASSSNSPFETRARVLAARMASEVCETITLKNERGYKQDRVPGSHLRPVCIGRKHTVVTTGGAGSSGLPCAMVLTAYFVLL